jgi:hypothetical protein
MKDRTPKNPVASIRARLLNHSREHNDNFQRVLTRYAIERLLFRLSQTEAAARYILKGAMLFVTWPENAFRPTGDLDLLGQGNPEPASIAELFTGICQVAVPEDGIIFDPATLRVDPAREEDEYRGVVVRLRGYLGTAIAHVQIDIGFGDHVYPAPKLEAFPCLLAEMPAPRILMYPPETVVAEKFEAMVRFGEANGRIKDFYDIWVAARTFPFELPKLLEAVGGTLRRRETAFPVEIPVGLTDAYAVIAEEKGLWTGFLRRTPPTLDPPTFPALQEELRRLFGPVIAFLGVPEGAKGQWNPQRSAWS